MANSARRLKTTFLFVILSLITAPLMAALPVSVNGQPLPTLAPMLARTTPAVVNIATLGHIEVRQNPLMQDPLFRHFFKLP